MMAKAPVDKDSPKEPAKELPVPQSGGRYIRNDETGELTLVTPPAKEGN